MTLPIGRLSTAIILGRMLCLGVLLSLVGCAAYAPPHKGEKIYPGVLFASPQGQRLRMDLYVPQTAQPAPVVVWIFGGSWKFGSKGFHVNVRDLTRSGIAVASIQYRMSGKARYPAQLQDCETAVRWLRANGSRYGIDPQRIGVSGESAGGHLAALLGTVEGAPAIRAVFAMYPPTDLLSLGRQYAKPGRTNDVEKLLGGPIEDKRALAAEASPVNHVSTSSPPTLIIHGAKDTVVPLAQSQDLQRRLARAHVEARLIVVPDKGHWFALDKNQLAEVAAFFHSHFVPQRMKDKPAL